jgi:hypothetical protein
VIGKRLDVKLVLMIPHNSTVHDEKNIVALGLIATKKLIQIQPDSCQYCSSYDHSQVLTMSREYIYKPAVDGNRLCKD